MMINVFGLNKKLYILHILFLIIIQLMLYQTKIIKIHNIIKIS